MPSIYTEFNSNSYRGDCPICWQSLENTDAVAHSGDGQKHPYHRACAKTAALMQQHCPMCKIPIDTSSLFSNKEKCVMEFKKIRNDMLIGMSYGVFSVVLNTCVKGAQSICPIVENTLAESIGGTVAGPLAGKLAGCAVAVLASAATVLPFAGAYYVARKTDFIKGPKEVIQVAIGAIGTGMPMASIGVQMARGGVWGAVTGFLCRRIGL